MRSARGCTCARSARSRARSSPGTDIWSSRPVSGSVASRTVSESMFVSLDPGGATPAFAARLQRRKSDCDAAPTDGECIGGGRHRQYRCLIETMHESYRDTLYSCRKPQCSWRAAIVFNGGAMAHPLEALEKAITLFGPGPAQ